MKEYYIAFEQGGYTVHMADSIESVVMHYLNKRQKIKSIRLYSEVISDSEEFQKLRKQIALLDLSGTTVLKQLDEIKSLLEKVTTVKKCTC